MKLVIVALLALLVGQEPTLVSIPPPAVANDAWNYVLECTKSIGLTPAPGYNLANVKWFKAKMPHTPREFDAGGFAYPDTIAIDDRMLDQRDVVAHELLHYLMHIDPNDNGVAGPHPFVPFYFPCKLMASQTIIIDPHTGVLIFRGTGLRLVPRTPVTPYKWPI